MVVPIYLAQKVTEKPYQKASLDENFSLYLAIIGADKKI